MTAQHDAQAPAATIARTTAPEPLYGVRATRRVTVRDIAAAKGRGEKWPSQQQNKPNAIISRKARSILKSTARTRVLV